jgi:hypothetical protein
MMLVMLVGVNHRIRYACVFLIDERLVGETEEEAKKRRFRLRALNLRLGLGWVWPFAGTAGEVTPAPEVQAG